MTNKKQTKKEEVNKTLFLKRFVSFSMFLEHSSFLLELNNSRSNF